jgi:hypothetical protein
MSKTWRLFLLIAGTFVFAVLALVLANSEDRSSQAGMGHPRLNVTSSAHSSNTQEISPTMHAMSTKRMDLDPPMKLTRAAAGAVKP